MHAIVETFSILTSVVLVVLCVLELRRWLRTRDRAAGWVALAFLTLALIVTVGRFVPTHPKGFFEGLSQRVDIELLVLFPYLLYRFATEFIPPGRRLRRIVATLTVGLTVWTFLLRHIPAAGEPRSNVFFLYLLAFLAHWTILSIAVTRRLWSAGYQQPSVAATRMRLLAFASAALTLAIIGVAFSGNGSAAGAIAQAMGFVASLGFFLGLEPPGALRTYWRRPENERMQEAIRGLMTLATTRAEIAHRVLGPSAHVVGARGTAMYDADGELLATHGVTSGGEEVRIDKKKTFLNKYFYHWHQHQLKLVYHFVFLDLDYLNLHHSYLHVIHHHHYLMLYFSLSMLQLSPALLSFLNLWLFQQLH